MKTILIQLDTDPQPSSFDRVVAVDAGVDELFSYGGVTPENVEPLVHGAMFTRGGDDLKKTALFIGGSNVLAGAALLERVSQSFFGPVRVSVMIDSNGSNTTAAAAVLSAGAHVPLKGAEALVLGGTGPVGLRSAELLAREGVHVRLASRSLERAGQACDTIAAGLESASLQPVATDSPAALDAATGGVALIIAAGAAGVELLSQERLGSIETLKVAIDLNAVPPAGLAGIEATDRACERHGVICYGAIGVGRLKMKIHKAAVAQLFEANDQQLDTSTIYAIGEALVSAD